MTSNENPHQGINIDAFLSTSREYLLLPLPVSKSPRQSFASILTSNLLRARMGSYRKFVQSLFLAAGVGAFVAGPAIADPGCDQKGRHSERHAKMMEQHHNKLHDALKLTADQEAAWKKLIDTEQPITALSGGQPEDWAKLNAPERAEKMLELSKARQVQMSEHVVALKFFYAMLSPEQQKVFEDFHSGPRAGMPGKPGPRTSGSSKP